MSVENQNNRDNETDQYVDFRFSKLREEQPDPTSGKVIEWLIDSDDGFIVYVDDEGYVEWNMNDNDMLLT